MPKEKNEFYVVVLNNFEEKEKLHKLSLKHNIPILYPDLFADDKEYYLWGISKSGVGLVGCTIARCTPKENVVHSLEELDAILSKN